MRKHSSLRILCLCLCAFILSQQTLFAGDPLNNPTPPGGSTIDEFNQNNNNAQNLIETQNFLETFHANGNLKQRDYLDIDNNKVYRTQLFNIDGILFEQDEIEDQGNIFYITKYDLSGSVIFEALYNVYISSPLSSRSYSADGKISDYDEYDDFGRRKQTVHLKTDGFISSIDIYDSSGAYVAATKIYGDLSVIERLDEFDSEGNLTKQTDYNAQGFKTQQRIWSPKDGVFLRRIFYDENENASLTADYDAADKLIYFKDTSVISDPEATLISESVTAAQTAAGLIASHPDDESFIYHEGIVADWAKINAKDQAYTYDQALFGISMVKSGNLDAAKKTLDFFNSLYLSESNFAGFWTVYDKDGGWKKYEYRKGMGENAWIALFAMHYANSAVTPEEKQKATELALGITRWIASIPHFQGAVAMGADAPGNPNWGTIYSVENMFDYYALLKGLIQNLPADSVDLPLINNERNTLKVWFKNNAYDASRNLFKKGGHTEGNNFVWDAHDALDVNSWALQAIGVTELINDFGVDVQAMTEEIVDTFAVQGDGTFGGDAFTARGFDFSDLDNASAIRSQGRFRPALHWIEGSAGMIVSYYQIAAYLDASFSSGSDSYETLGDHFLESSMETDVRTQNGNSVSYKYANQDNVQVFFGTDVWKTAPGNSIASSIWMFFASFKFNPFDLNS